MKILRYITFYEKDPSEDLIGEYELNKITIQDLEKLFGKQSNDPMFYACYPLYKEHVDYIEAITNVKLYLEKFDYFIECNRPLAKKEEKM
jgi:hypothetical protein